MLKILAFLTGVTILATPPPPGAPGDALEDSSSSSTPPAILSAKDLRPTLDVPSGIEGKAKSTEVRLEAVDSLRFVQAQVNGAGPFRFLLDTGGYLALNPVLVQKLGLKPDDGAIKGEGIGEKDVIWQRIHLKRIQIGGAYQENLAGFVMPDLEHLGKVLGKTIDGVFGLELFWNFVAKFEDDWTRLTLIPDVIGWKYEGKGLAVPFRFVNHMPIIQAELDGVRAQLELDTGFNGSLNLQAPFAATHAFREKARRSLESSAIGVGGRVNSYTIRARELKIGNLTVAEPIVSLSASTKGGLALKEVDGLLGNKILTKFDVIFDYAGLRVILEPTPALTKRDEYNLTGFEWDLEGSGRITQVYADSPAEAAGLKPDDVILEINHRNFTDYTNIELRALVRSRPGAELLLRVRSGSSEREIVLVLKELI